MYAIIYEQIFGTQERNFAVLSEDIYMRTVLHCDMNNYFASVETVDKPRLALVPMAVCGDPRMRHGIVLAKNEMAKLYGVTTGESAIAARRKCPGLVVVPPHYRKYEEYSKRTREIFSRFSYEVHPFGIDEAWLVLPDGMSEMAGALVADELRRVIKRELGITASVGVSYNYIFSKLASDMKKPDATTCLPERSLENTIWELPARDMLFVGRATGRELSMLGIKTIGDIARQRRELLCGILGKRGDMLWRFANGDDSGFDPGFDREEDVRSVTNSVTPPRDICSAHDASAFLYVLSGSIAARLVRYGLKTSCVSISVRREDFSRYTRQRTLVHPTDDQNIIYRYAEGLLRDNHDWIRGIRSIGVGADRLSGTHGEQLTFFPEESIVPPIAGEIGEIMKKYDGFKLERA